MFLGRNETKTSGLFLGRAARTGQQLSVSEGKSERGAAHLFVVKTDGTSLYLW